MQSHTMARNPTATRAKILKAAQEITMTQGVGGASLEAVAALAGVSKGGLLYHFPSKSALMQALVEDFLTEARARLENCDPARPNAVLHEIVDGFERDWDQDDHDAGLLAALAEDPAILAPLGDYQDHILTRARAESDDPVLAELVIHALNGLRSDRLFGINSTSPEGVTALLTAIRSRIA